MRAAHEVVQLGERLDAGVAGAYEREREPPLGGVEVGVREVELVQHVVAQRDRVGEVLELERVLAHGHGRRARQRAERDHDLVVA